MATVHLTMFEEPVEVPDDEVPVLQGQGLLRDPGKSQADQDAEAYQAALERARAERAAAEGGKDTATATKTSGAKAAGKGE